MIVELVVGVPLYFMTAGVARTVLWQARVSDCPECRLDPDTGRWVHVTIRKHGYTVEEDKNDARYAHSFEAFWAAILWPIALPWTLGTRLDAHVRRDRRHRKELLEALHHKRLVQIRMEESALIDQQLASMEKADTIEDRSGSEE